MVLVSNGSHFLKNCISNYFFFFHITLKKSFLSNWSYSLQHDMDLLSSIHFRSLLNLEHSLYYWFQISEDFNMINLLPVRTAHTYTHIYLTLSILLANILHFSIFSQKSAKNIAHTVPLHVSIQRQSHHCCYWLCWALSTLWVAKYLVLLVPLCDQQSCFKICSPLSPQEHYLPHLLLQFRFSCLSLLQFFLVPLT